MEQVILEAKDGYQLHLKVYEVENPKGIVQILHGMQEWQNRYEYLALQLNAIGFSAITSNMRGHGEDAPVLGYFGPKKGYQYLVDDQKRITDYILNRYQQEKIILFAHSMGSITARNVLQTYSHKYSKVILSGYPESRWAASFGIMIANAIILLKGPQYTSQFVENVSVISYNRFIEHPKTRIDWIAYNEATVRFFIESPYCGHGFKVAAYRDLFHIVKDMHRKSLFQNVNSDLPILLISGVDDAVTGFHRGALKTKRELNTIGFNSIYQKEYPNMRHEILNEVGKEIVIKDIIDFIEEDYGNLGCL